MGGIVVGSIIGLIFGSKATILKPLGDIFLNLMFTIVVPMVFVSITSAVGSMVDLKRLGKILGATVFIFIITGLIASAFILITINLFPPAAGSNISLEAVDGLQEAKTLSEIFVNSITVGNFGDLLRRENMLPLIVFSILFGLATSVSGGQNSNIGKTFKELNDIIMKIVDYIMMYAPIGLGAYFANLIGDLGPDLIRDYARVLLIYYPVVIIYMLTMFPIYAYFSGGKLAIRKMSQYIMGPAVTAFATQSSMATLPTNKDACLKIGVPEDVSNIVLPMGATMHMDGSVIASIVKISFLFGIFKIPFTGFGTYAAAIVVSILAAFVLSGTPGGGLVGEMLTVSLFNFPPEAFPIIATIGFLVDAPATMLNASGDTIASMMVTRIIEGKDWLLKTENKKA